MTDTTCPTCGSAVRVISAECETPLLREMEARDDRRGHFPYHEYPHPDAHTHTKTPTLDALLLSVRVFVEHVSAGNCFGITHTECPQRRDLDAALAGDSE